MRLNYHPAVLSLPGWELAAAVLWVTHGEAHKARNQGQPPANGQWRMDTL